MASANPVATAACPKNSPASVSRTTELLMKTMKVAEGRGGGWGGALDHADPADPLASWIAGGTRSAEMLAEPLRSLYK